MKIRIVYKPSIIEEDVDLTDYGYDEDVDWDSLTVEQQNDILDPLREVNIPYCSITKITDL